MREVEARLKISAVDRTGKVLANIGNRLQDVNRRADAFNRTQSTISTQMQAMSINLPTAAALIAAYEIPTRVGRELARATAAAADFETALFNIQKKSGASKEEVAKLGDEIRQLSREMPLSRDEIAAGMERGAAAGIPIAELKDFTRMTAMIADGWEVTAEESGNFVAGFSKGLKIPIKDMQAFASLINDLADSGIADEKDIADFIDRAGASLVNFGMTPNEVAAYGASFLNLKMPAEVAARAMDTLSGKLLAPENLGKKSRTALTAIVGDLGKFSKLSGNEKLNRFMKSLQGMTNQRKASLLGALLGEGFDDEIMRVVSAFDEVQRNMDMAHKQAANPSSSILTLYEKQLETFNKRVLILKGQLSDIELSLGNRLLPLAEKVVSTVSKGLKAQDAYDAGRTKTTGDDPAMVTAERDEFRRRLKEAGMYRGDDMLLWKARRAVGTDSTKYPNVFKFLDEHMRNEVFGGNLSGGPKRRYPKGYLPKDYLGADPAQYSVEKPPTPLVRPSQKERDDFKLSQSYRVAGGRHAGRRELDAALAQISDKQEAMEERFYLEDLANADWEKRHFRLTGDEQRNPTYDRPKPLRERLGMDTNRYGGSIFGDRTEKSKRRADDKRDREIAEGRAEKIRRLRGDENREPAFPMKKPRTILGSIFAENDDTSRDTGAAADKVASSLEQGGQKIKDGADAGGQKIEQSGMAFAEAIARASSNLTQAVSQAAAMLANLKVNVNTVGGVTPSKVNANTGKTNEFVKGPTGMGPR